MVKTVGKSVQLGVICRICLKIWYVAIDVLLGTITVVFPATTQTLFLVVYRLPAATVAPLLKDFVCKKQYLVKYKNHLIQAFL
jgi:hypothetical protein